MSRRLLQSICIAVLFLFSFVAVVLLGIDRGQSDLSLKNHGIPLDEKASWEASLKGLPQDSDPIVYVTEKGTKYHISPDCSALKRAKSIVGMSLSSAEDHGKELCSICAKS